MVDCSFCAVGVPARCGLCRIEGCARCLRKCHIDHGWAVAFDRSTVRVKAITSFPRSVIFVKKL